jgi:predicted NAD-dependent protein-ADP-ribosyltransferase YbiA (DUF1768 family)
VSRIEQDVSYPELKKVDPSDLKMESNLYQIDALGVSIIVAVGDANHDKDDENLTTFPIYLVKKNNKVTRIGLYEISASNISSYVDDDGKLKVEKMDEPLLFSFVDQKMLSTLRKPPEEEELVTSEDIFKSPTPGINEIINETVDENVGINLPDKIRKYFDVIPGRKLPKPLKTETKTDASNITRKYQTASTDTWLQKMMENRNYKIVDNEGGGNCFFAAIRDAFLGINIKISVDKLRKIFANEVTDDFFTQYKTTYNNYNSSLLEDSYKIKELQEKSKKIGAEYNATLDRKQRAILYEEYKIVKEQNDTLVNENKITRRILQEVSFMKDIDTFEKFKKIILKSDFWADAATISTLERILQVKFIILLRGTGDKNTSVQCGEDNGVVHPLYYIIVDYDGGIHYQLVTYKETTIFKFSEIPYGIKEMIVDKCMEKNAGGFPRISEFISFKDQLLSKDKKRSAKQKKDEVVADKLTDAEVKGLYDDNIVFVFYAKSYNKPLPGKGSGEKIPDALRKSFSQLALIPEWRRKLSYEWVQPFSLDDHKWASVETYYQAQKFKKVHPEFYLLFTMDSSSNEGIANDPEMAKAAGSKTGKYKNQLIRPKEIKIDPEFYKKYADKVLYEALFAKFSQHEDLKEMLLNTQNAKLVQYLKSRKGEVCNDLMLVRDKLVNP